MTSQWDEGKGKDEVKRKKVKGKRKADILLATLSWRLQAFWF